MTKGPCLLESRPRGERYYAVGRSTESLQSPLDFVSGCGLVSAPFRARPTRGFFRRALGRTPERGNETAQRPTAAERELVARSPHTESAVERSIPLSLSLASGVPQGGTPLVDSFPYFLANQEIGNARPLLSQRVPSHGMGRRRQILPDKLPFASCSSCDGASFPEGEPHFRR